MRRLVQLVVVARQLKKKREPAAPASTTVLPMQLQVGGTPARSCKEETLMPTFVATDPVGYEKFVGRWSQRLAPLFAEYAGVTAGERGPRRGLRHG